MYHARPAFERFQRQSKQIGTLQSKLPDGRWTSNRIKRIYDERSRKRDHSQDAAVNEKTHAFWSHGELTDRITLTLGDVGITVTEVSEYDTSSECPVCGSETVMREGDSFRCHGCELDAHSDIVGAWNMLQSEVGPMARPAALSAGRDRDAPTDGAYWQWNDHDWIPGSFGEQSWSGDQPSVSKPASSQPG